MTLRAAMSNRGPFFLYVSLA